MSFIVSAQKQGNYTITKPPSKTALGSRGKTKGKITNTNTP